MSNIEWTEETWNPILGCTKISPGCQQCYAVDQAYRNWEMAKALPKEKRGRLAYYEDLTQKTKWGSKEWTGILKFVPEALQIPLKRKKPQTYFVNSMSDMFHERCRNEWIQKIFDVIRKTPQHTYQILTKRPSEMIGFIDFYGIDVLSNVWLGTSIENQKAVSERALPLFRCHNRGWKTFYSCEPLLEQVELYLNHEKVDWVIVGGESGNHARECKTNWIADIVEQCRLTKTPVFVKQMGANVFSEDGIPLKLKNKKGGDILEFPKHLQIREMPEYASEAMKISLANTIKWDSTYRKLAES